MEKAIELFLGVSESTFENILTKEKYQNLMVLDEIWTFSFIQLLTLKHPSTEIKEVEGDSQTSTEIKGMEGDSRAKMIPIFFKGQKKIRNIIENPDYLSNTPLEIAYRWVLPLHFTLRNVTRSFKKFCNCFRRHVRGKNF